MVSVLLFVELVTIFGGKGLDFLRGGWSSVFSGNIQPWLRGEKNREDKISGRQREPPPHQVRLQVRGERGDLETINSQVLVLFFSSCSSFSEV